MINRVVLVGRLTRDVEVRQTPSNLSVATFTVACDRRQSAASRQQGEQKQADFITCVAWRQTADFLGRYAKKGALVGVEGRIQTRNYDDPKEPGRKVYVTEVQCDNVQLLESKSASTGRTSSDYSMASNSVPNNQPAAQSAPADNGDPNSFDDMTGPSLDISSDDLPF